MNPSKKSGNTITPYYMEKEDLAGVADNKIEDYDLLSVITICLGGEGQKNNDGILKLLNLLLSDSEPEETKKEILQTEYKIKMTQELEREVSIMCNLSQVILEKGIRKTAENMLGKNYDIVDIMEITGLTKEEIEEIQKNMLVSQ